MLVLVWRQMSGGMWAIAGLLVEARLVWLGRAIAKQLAEAELLMLGRSRKPPVGPSNIPALGGP